MRARFHDDAAAFLAAADAFLRSDPFSTSVIAVVAQRTAEDPESDTDCLWITLEDQAGRLQGVAMHTPPFPLFLSRMPKHAAVALAESVLEDGRGLPGVNGACEPAAAFLEVWSQRTGESATLVHAMRMYRLERLDPPRAVPGRSAPADAPADIERLVRWFRAFHVEALPHAPEQDPAPIVERRVAAGEIQLWRDADTPVSVAAVSRPAAGAARIGPVYTPPEARRNGYGAAVTAAAAAAAIERGAEHVLLYADLANPTSNSIYQTIGFRPDHDAASHLFRASAGSAG